MRSITQSSEKMPIEIDQGVRKIFSLPTIYNLFQNFIAGNAGEWLFSHHWNLKNFKGKIIDIGSGTSLILKYLPSDIEYVGFDVNKDYISRAKKMWSDRPNAVFLHGTLQELSNHPDLQQADLMICAGVLHHMDDSEVEQIFDFIVHRLNPGGKFLSHEPCYLLRQGWLHRFILKWDRGQGIRTEQAWKKLIARYFPNWQTDILTGLLRIPFTHILMQGSKSA